MSFSETFNVVTADAVFQRVPVVVSREVPFIDYDPCIADPTLSQDIAQSIAYVLSYKNKIVAHNFRTLQSYNEESRRVWKDFIYNDI
jgi:hypothetical protein